MTHNKVLTKTLAGLFLTCGFVSVNAATVHDYSKRADLLGVTPVSTLDKTISKKGISRSSVNKIPMTPVITDPQGKTSYYVKSMSGIYQWANAVEFDDIATTLVWGDDNDVYIYNIISVVTYMGFSFDSYIKGTVQGDEIVVDLPQSVFEVRDSQEYGDYNANLVVLKLDGFDERGRPNYVYAPDIQSFSYSYDKETGRLELKLPGKQFGGFDSHGNIDYDNLPDYGLGYVWTDDEGLLFGVVDFAQAYDMYELQEPVSIPENVTTTGYSLMGQGVGFKVTAAFDGNDFYLKGLSEFFPEATLKGEINPEDNMLSFPQNQFLGVYSDYFIFSKCYLLNPDYNPEDPYSQPYSFAPDDREYLMSYNPESESFTSLESNILLGLNGTKDFLNPIGGYGQFELIHQTDFSGVPNAPSNVYYNEDLLQSLGYADVFFYLYPFSEDGNLLDVDSLYYTVYLEDEPYVFEQEETYDATYGYPITIYPGVLEPTDRLPYTFTNYTDIYKSTPLSHLFDIGIYVEGYSSVGVQAVYEYEGVTTTSDIVRYYIDDSSVKSEAASKIIISKEYFDLNGIKIDNPQEGFFIVKTHYSDGSVKTAKKILK